MSQHHLCSLACPLPRTLLHSSPSLSSSFSSLPFPFPLPDLSLTSQLTKSTGKAIESLDLSSCTLTDESCQSIARHCQCIEELGLRNLREITGVPLNQLFQDRERAKNIRAVTLSGSRKVNKFLRLLLAPQTVLGWGVQSKCRGLDIALGIHIFQAMNLYC